MDARRAVRMRSVVGRIVMAGLACVLVASCSSKEDRSSATTTVPPVGSSSAGSSNAVSPTSTTDGAGPTSAASPPAAPTTVDVDASDVEAVSVQSTKTGVPQVCISVANSQSLRRVSGAIALLFSGGPMDAGVRVITEAASELQSYASSELGAPAAKAADALRLLANNPTTLTPESQELVADSLQSLDEVLSSTCGFPL